MPYYNLWDIKEKEILKKNDKIYDGGWVRQVTTDLHHIRGQLLSYAPLLMDLKNSVKIIQVKSDPDKGARKGKAKREKFLREECNCLIAEIDKQHGSRDAPDKKLENIMNLVITISYACDATETNWLTVRD
jgi:hypothetical protein